MTVIAGEERTIESRAHLFGIRHHGPGSALALERALIALDPAAVLIEGPPEADALVPLAGSDGMRPPLALLVYAVDNPATASFHPFAEYSPEWRAIRWALRHDRPVRFIDLPAAHRFAATMAREAPEDGRPASEDAAPATVAPTEAGAIRADPLGHIARLAGYEEGELWWNRFVEEGMHSPLLFAAIEELMTVLRRRLDDDDPHDGTDTLTLASATAEGGDRRLWEARREAQMRLGIADALGTIAGPIAVVTGAWHVPALRRKVRPAEDRALLRGLPRLKVAAAWVPWTDRRLTAASGYGAGVVSPGWYRHLWAERAHRSGGGAGLAARWQARVAALLRDQGLVASTASVIDAVRLTTALAALRGLATPGLAEMRDASLATLTNGDPTPLALVEDRLVVGTEVGAVDADSPLLPLQADLARQVRALRLKPTALAEELSLDLRSEAGLARSILLHRLALIDVPWGKLGDPGRSRGTFRERWTLCWEPELSVRLVEALAWGTTIAAAAAGRASSIVAESKDLAALAGQIGLLLMADLPAAIDGAVIRLQALAATASDLTTILRAVPPLARVLRYGEARRMPEVALRTLLVNLAIEASILLPVGSRGIDRDQAVLTHEALASFDTTIPLIEDEAVREAWEVALATLAAETGAAALLRGFAVRRLSDLGRLPADTLAGYLSRALSSAVPPAEAGDWLEGFLGQTATLLVLDHSLRGLVDDWLSGLTGDAFLEVLPLLRRIFGKVDAMERRRLFVALDVRRRGDTHDGFAAAADTAGGAAFRTALPLLDLILGLSP